MTINDSYDLKPSASVDEQGACSGANLTASVFASIIACSAALANIALRTGLSDLEIVSTIKLLCLSLLLIFSASVFGAIPSAVTQKIAKSHSSCVSVMLGLVVLLGSINELFHLSMHLLVILAGLLSAWKGLVEFGKTKQRPRMLWFATVAICFSVWLIAVQLHPLFFEEISRGKAYVDTMFDCCISNLLQTFGTVTTGYDGPVSFPYHVGSNWLFIKISSLLKVDMLAVCSKGQLVLFFPLMVKALLSLIFDFVETISPSGWKDLLHCEWSFWVVFVLGFIGILPADVAVKMALSWHTIVLTITYTTSMLLLFLILSFVLSFVREKSSNAALTLLAATIPPLLFVSGMVKQSLLYCLLTAFVYVFVRKQLFRRSAFLVAFFISIAASVVAVKMVYLGVVPYKYFDFYITYVKPNLYMVFPFAYYFWFWAYLALVLSLQRSASGKLQRHHQTRQLILEAVLVVIFATQIPPNVFAIPGGSGILFLEPQQWICFALVLSLHSVWKELSANVMNSAAQNWKTVLVISLIPLLCVTGLSSSTNYTSDVWSGLQEYVVTRSQILGTISQTQETLDRFKLALFRLRPRQCFTSMCSIIDYIAGPIQDKLNASESYRYVVALHSLYSSPMAIKKRTLVYVPHSNIVYWDMYPCSFAPMVEPALTGFASLAGLPPATCTDAKFYGLAFYPPRVLGDPAYSSSHPMSTDLILKLAEKRQFKRILMLNDHDRSRAFKVIDGENDKSKNQSNGVAW